MDVFLMTIVFSFGLSIGFGLALFVGRKVIEQTRREVQESNAHSRDVINLMTMFSANRASESEKERM